MNNIQILTQNQLKVLTSLKLGEIDSAEEAVNQVVPAYAGMISCSMAYVVV